MAGFVGRAGIIHKMLSESLGEVSLQMLLTHVYVKDPTRLKYNLKIDHLSKLFQNLNGATGMWGGAVCLNSLLYIILHRVVCVVINLVNTL